MTTDPLTGFNYPAAWVDLCDDEDRLELVGKGLAVLTSDGKLLRRGFTTGTTAAAACKAAVLSLRTDVHSVVIDLSCGLSVTVPCLGSRGIGSCGKFSGDYTTDVTSGIVFVCRARIHGKGIDIEFGDGIGRLTRPFNGMAEGDAAVSRNAIESIRKAVGQALDLVGAEGAKLDVAVRNGAEIAKRTMNERVGIVGGISVLGSTGLVEPWDDHVGASVMERVRSSDRVVLTTGRVGLRYSRLLFPDRESILVGVNMAQAIQEAKGEVVLCGLPGLILKFLEPKILDGTGCKTVDEMMDDERWHERMLTTLSRARCIREDLRIVLIDRSGNVVGESL